MTPDQKLQAWDFTALSLETDGVINSSSLTSSVLLCKYNFRCLPASAKPGMIKGRKGVHSLDDNLYLEMLRDAYL